MEDADILGFLTHATVLGKYVEVRVKLLNYMGLEEVLPILIYYGEPPQVQEPSGVKEGDRDVRACKGASCNNNGGGSGSKIGSASLLRGR